MQGNLALVSRTLPRLAKKTCIRDSGNISIHAFHGNEPGLCIKEHRSSLAAELAENDIEQEGDVLCRHLRTGQSCNIAPQALRLARRPHDVADLLGP